ncbi:hypothetical protein ACJX0J_016084, partial [Zea mays]
AFFSICNYICYIVVLLDFILQAGSEDFRDAFDAASFMTRATVVYGQSEVEGKETLAPIILENTRRHFFVEEIFFVFITMMRINVSYMRIMMRINISYMRGDIWTYSIGYMLPLDITKILIVVSKDFFIHNMEDHRHWDRWPNLRIRNKISIYSIKILQETRKIITGVAAL